MPLTVLFRAPTRVGLPNSQVVRCSCGTISEVPSPIVSPNNNSSWMRWDSCSACRSDISRRQLQHAHTKLALKHTGFGTLQNRIAPTSREQEAYFASAPKVLAWDRIAFTADKQVQVGTTSSFTTLDQQAVTALTTVYTRLMANADQLHPNILRCLKLMSGKPFAELPKALLPDGLSFPIKTKETSHDSGNQAHP